MALVRDDVGQWRPNGQPPAARLVAQVQVLDGTLSGSVYPRGPGSPRMRIDGIRVPASHAVQFAELLRQWRLPDGARTARDISVVEGWTEPNAADSEWAASGKEFTELLADDVAIVSFWWD